MSSMPPTSPPPRGPLLEAPGATAGMVFGILSIVLGGPVIGLILALIGFMKSKEAKAFCRAHPGQCSNEGVASAGYICSIIGLILGGIATLCTCGYLAFIGVILGAAAGNSP